MRQFIRYSESIGVSVCEGIYQLVWTFGLGINCQALQKGNDIDNQF